MAIPYDPQFYIDREAIYQLVKAKGCKDAKEIAQANTYSQLLDILIDFSKTFDCDPAYLGSLLDVVADATLVTLGVYYNKTGTDVTNPKWIVQSTYELVTINDPVSLEIVKGSEIDKIVVEGNTILPSLVIASASTVTLLEVKSGSCISTLYIKNCPNPAVTGQAATLTSIAAESCVNDVAVDDGTTYGGFECPSPFNSLP